MLLALLPAALLLSACRSAGPMDHVEIERVQTARAPEPIVMLNLHENESTSVEAARRYLATYPAPEVTLLVLRHDGQRNVTFESGGAVYRIDPNRMFSNAGAQASVAALSDTATSDPASASRHARDLAARVLEEADLENARYLVALHNNTEANYQASSYLPDSVFAADAALVHLNPKRDPDDFFFVTERALFERLAELGLNVVLQSAGGAVTDDGSLSVYAAQRGIGYVNVEAQHGHVAEQTEMLVELMPLLQDGL